jgi:RNA polymerase sigma-70 factor, ECF subfamily
VVGDSRAQGSSDPMAGQVELPESADPAALWDAFAPPLRAFLARRVPAGVEADDLLQEVFLRVVKHLDTLRTTERPEAWLFQIARNALRDSLRARQRKDGRTDPLEIDLPAETDTAAVRDSEEELAPCLTPMIGRLPEPYRTAIELTSVQGLTQAQAASRVGVSVSGMKSRVQRGREQLRQMLLRCCQIDVDARGGVSDFHLRSADACGDGGTASPSRAIALPLQLVGRRLRPANKGGDDQ